MIQAFKEDEVAKIYKNKLLYSIIKYNRQPDKVKELFTNKYTKALDLNSCSFDNEIIDEVIEYLEKEKIKYDEILDNNQELINLVADQIALKLIDEAKTLPNDLEKCRFLFEYIASTFIYDKNTINYNRSIPFGEDYNFEFYKGIPVSKSYEGLLVTKTGSSDSISNLLVYLGNKLGLDIGTITCEYDNHPYMLNTVNIYGNISYMDVTSVLAGRCRIKDACLVDSSKLKEYADFKNINEEGITQSMYFSTPYNFKEIIDIEKRILPATEYLSNNIFTK